MENTASFYSRTMEFCFVKFLEEIIYYCRASAADEISRIAEFIKYAVIARMVIFEYEYFKDHFEIIMMEWSF